MQDLVPLAETVAARLTARRETVAIAESSTGGLISAALLALPGASAYFLGGAVVYTAASRAALLDVTPDDMKALDLRPATEPYAALLATRIRERHTATWGLGETGAAGPSGNRYGDHPGHSCIAIAGLSDASMTLETGKSDRLDNMHAFTAEALHFLLKTLPK